VGVGVEVVEGRHATGGDAGELDEGPVQVRRVHRRGRVAGEGPDAGAADETEAALGVVARLILQTELHEGTESAVSGGRAGVSEDLTASTEAALAVEPGLGVDEPILGADPAADPEAGVAAGDVEEPGAMHRADTNVIDRCRLLHGKIGSLCPGNRGETRGGPEQKALHELHSDLQISRPRGGGLRVPEAFRPEPLNPFPLALSRPDDFRS
jgi:hypothetical protein